MSQTTSRETGPGYDSDAPGDIDGPYAWARLAMCLLISMIGGAGLWSVVVVLPAVKADFGVSRADASLPYTFTLIGVAIGTVLMGKLADKVGIVPALIVGGIAILLIERAVKDQRFHGIADIPMVRVLAIGFIQCLAMVPGVSRSGATIMGALMLGVERRTAAEFSFFLAIPTMLGATALELIKKGDRITSAVVGWDSIALGFVVSFIVALLVIRWFVGLVSKHGFAPFAWYRIIAGIAALIWLGAR